MKRAFACLITAGVALAGCGGASGGAPVAPANAESLRADLASVRTAAFANEPAAAHAATARMRADVQRLLSTGALSTVDGRLMLTALAHVDARVSAEVHATSPATATVAPTAPAPGPHHGPKPHQHVPDRGHGPGPGGGGGGD